MKRKKEREKAQRREERKGGPGKERKDRGWEKGWVREGRGIRM